MQIFRRKPILTNTETGLKKALGPFDLTLLGIGAIIGAGIFVLTGIAAAKYAGPGIVYSYIISGFACLFTAFAYAELAASIGGCGSAYGYAYAGLGEIIAWIIGWDLILEYGVATPAVAIGWSGYVDNALTAMGMGLPDALISAPAAGGLVNLPAMLIILLLSVVLCIGVNISANFNAFMVVIKLIAIVVFIVVASGNVNPANWDPFLPFGINGVAKGAALIFFAYIGFDAVSTAAEEAKNPQKDLPIGIIVSLLFCTIIYVVVSGLLTGIVPYHTLNVPSPVADAFLRLGYNWVSGIISAGAIAGLTTVMLVLYYGLTRVFFAISRDGLLPPVFSSVHPKTQTPVRVIIVSGIIMSLIAGFTPISQVAELVNIGTLAAFVLVCAGVIALRHKMPDIKRPFKCPFSPLFPILGMIFCLYLMCKLPLITWLRFIIWLVLGLIIYFAYSKNNCLLAKKDSYENFCDK
jgi:APA family basic amino acid/polyamine antiporter